MLRDRHEDLIDAGIRVVGISPQDEASHTRFRDKHALPFTLLADTDKTAVKKYDVNGPLGFGVRRATFLIGSDGVIQDVMLADLRIDRHETLINEALRRAAASQSP